jgi:hypothetical protein
LGQYLAAFAVARLAVSSFVHMPGMLEIVPDVAEFPVTPQSAAPAPARYSETSITSGVYLTFADDAPPGRGTHAPLVVLK